MRIKFVGELRVYRDSVLSTQLSAKVETPNSTLHYHPCPKSFEKLVTDGLDNKKMVSFTATVDGTNPRACCLLP